MYSNTTEFLSHIAKLRGKLGKKGVHDFESAAQTVLYEWTSGKVRHYVLPPSPSDLAGADAEALAAGLITVGFNQESPHLQLFQLLFQGPRIVSHLSTPLDVNAL